MSARAIISKLPAAAAAISIAGAARSSSLRLSLLRPLASLAVSRIAVSSTSAGWRCFSSRPTTSSLNDSSPNWSNRPPKETILLDGCDFEHWLVVMDPPDPSWTRDDIIGHYIKTLAQIVGSEEEARMKIYSVSTKHYFAFGALVSEELSYKIKELPKVRWVLPDSYLDVKNKDYGGEPFINGQAVPYDPKYHEEWVRNNARANERSRRNDRPRNFDRSRNFERRRENMQNFQNRDVPPTPMPNNPPPGNVPPVQMPNNPPPGAVPPAQMPTAPPQNAMPPRDMPPPPPPNMANMGPQYAGHNSYQNQMPPHGSYPPHNPPFQGGQGYQGGTAGGPSHQGGIAGGPGYQGGMAGGPGYQGGPAPGYQPGPGFQGNNPPYQGGGNMGYQGGRPNPGAYQGGGQNYPSNGMNYQGGHGGNGYQGGGSFQDGGPNFQGRDMGGRDPQ